MNSPKRAQITLRLSPRVDRKVAEAANRLGISKNAFITLVVAKAVGESDESLATAEYAVGE